ncbi:hypothetical protein [Jannaschia rubra]|uniref:hypothetical protein n=1 Tax=Jannaschia rubra TaxID=282197 RepID=UPI00248FB856|nr:hypothetical protein [Jannaschia rubra]
MRSFQALLALVLFPAIWCGVVLAALPRAAEGRPVLVIPSPFGPSADQIVAQAGGYPVGLRPPLVGIVAHSTLPGFAVRLQDAGAMVLLNAERLPAFLCGANVQTIP